MESKNDEVIRLLCSHMKLERDKGVIELEKTLPNQNIIDRREFQKIIIKLLTDTENSWENKHGSLLGAKSLIPYLNIDDDIDCNFIFAIKQITQKLLTHVEIRVRLAAGEVLGCLCKKVGVEIYQETKDTILRLIQSNLERTIPEDDSSKLEQFETGKLIEKLVGGSGPERRGTDVAQIFQDSTGWQNLETSLKAFQFMVEGCGAHFQPFMDEELFLLIFKTLCHTNRFVRETGYYVCSSLVSCGVANEDSEMIENLSSLDAFGSEFYYATDELCKYLGKGLADNWSQVRLSASVATRNFLLPLPNNESRQLFYPILLPRMCLNRYYAADGVRNYSQETWRRVTGTAGKELVEQYIEATLSDNHAVREAACACIAELASKISKEHVRPYVNELLNTLVICFQDNSWPVRDAACLACGNFILCFPNESKPIMKSLYPLFYRNLSDSIPSVRQGAASSLASVVRAFGSTSLENILSHIRQSLENVKKQETECENYLDGEKESGKLDLVKKLRKSETTLYSNKSVYGSKLGRGIWCESTYNRETQPWEAADGCVYLIGELTHIKEIQNDVITVMALLKEAGRYRHYTHHVVFLETICKQIPIFAKNLGKKIFKNIAEDFFDIIFYSLGCENALTSSAASQCLSYMATFLGPNILRGKVQNFNPNLIKYLESVIHLAPY
ncbi:hypothetical protein Phum_PHUM604480 [Pediculus humanus corporis]|uniref:IPO4/5-like TPR repeats domain-containing protein n=1 Tax=Pediculus humanus subsp. corporis TaxID=121224 RepID=E0W3G1_PEDHC|nr:uncharacterized protein Phum_PHUM604480 [Pediculus humanus corporis]EEB20167.1 hypothetical protein Phum_PHUM604480 [Pediculus humanus corporis]